MITQGLVTDRQSAMSMFFSLKEKGNNVCWVTIANRNTRPLVFRGNKHVLSMHFDDVTSKIDGISHDQFRKLKNFLWNHHINSNNSWICLINCHAGISRSAAVGEIIECKFRVPVTYLHTPFPNMRILNLFKIDPNFK
jgi:predicted protein tyrosine phosphatase